MIIRELEYFSPSRIADSGQAFRIKMLDPFHCELVAYGRYLQIADMGDGSYAFSCSAKEFDSVWYDYFDLGRDYGSIEKTIGPSDSYLKEAAVFGRGIRILHQEVFETVISYIISQRRSIPSISTSVERISEICGKEIIPPKLSEPFIKPSKNVFYAFPSPEELSSLPFETLQDTGVGYRAPYIAEAAQGFACGKLDASALTKLSDEDLYKALISMYGVGIKVANCVMLFGFARTGRFPVDVWIQRIMDRYYGGSFDTSPYPDTAGIMQQFMFYYERTRQYL